MSYKEVLQYLYTQIPMFQKVGASAYKPGLQTSLTLDTYIHNPHKSYKTIHIAGTNGKGSVSHLLAAILQEAGYKVGLYTSPHLVDFRERIKVNGQKVNKEYVTDFIDKYRPVFEPYHPSFFELTSTMAFDYFQDQKVDIAVIETGLGGRLDSTNIISPILSIITNISMDHIQYLGDTLEKIAFEKAGIIKPSTPILIGERINESVANVFIEKAKEMGAPIYFAEDENIITNSIHETQGDWKLNTIPYGLIDDELGGEVQIKNAQTVLAALPLLKEQNISIPNEAVKNGFSKVCELTGLMGRWQKVNANPCVICDTGHNTGGWQYIGEQLKAIKNGQLHMIVGMVNDKDINGVLEMMPKNATYYFTQASIERAMPVNEFATLGEKHGLKGNSYPTVYEAIEYAMRNASKADTIFIGGSTFIVADALPYFIKDIQTT